jgi:cell division protease FtsH
MDGFDTNTNIIVIASTNRPDVLDPALMRSGRFDRKVMVGRPTLEEREMILNIHAKGKKIAKDVDMN